MHLTRVTQLSIVASSIVLAGALVSYTKSARVRPHVISSVASPAGASPTVGAHVAPIAAAKNERLERADALHARAISMQTAGRAREAAALHRESAELRPADDSSATSCLEFAGNLLADAGRLVEARTAMRDAAAHALGRGDVAHAAELTLMAGFVARQQGDAAGVAKYAREARRLANAPSVTVAQRLAILGHLPSAGREPTQ